MQVIYYFLCTKNVTVDKMMQKNLHEEIWIDYIVKQAGIYIW